MSTLLGPVVVLVATIATLRIALSQPDQPATAKSPSHRARNPDSTTGEGVRDAERTAAPIGRPASRPGMMTPVAPAGFSWMDAAPAAKVRSGLALVVILAVLGAVLALAVAGLIVGATAALQG